MLKSVLSVRSSQSENFAEENVYLVTGDEERKTLRCQLFWQVNAKAGYLNQVFVEMKRKRKNGLSAEPCILNSESSVLFHSICC